MMLYDDFPSIIIETGSDRTQVWRLVLYSMQCLALYHLAWQIDREKTGTNVTDFRFVILAVYVIDGEALIHLIHMAPHPTDGQLVSRILSNIDIRLRNLVNFSGQPSLQIPCD